MRNIIDRALYRLHSALAHWHAVQFERHWRAASSGPRRASEHAIRNIGMTRADPNRSA